MYSTTLKVTIRLVELSVTVCCSGRSLSLWITSRQSAVCVACQIHSGSQRSSFAGRVRVANDEELSPTRIFCWISARLSSRIDFLASTADGFLQSNYSPRTDAAYFRLLLQSSSGLASQTQVLYADLPFSQIIGVLPKHDIRGKSSHTHTTVKATWHCREPWRFPRSRCLPTRGQGAARSPRLARCHTAS